MPDAAYVEGLGYWETLAQLKGTTVDQIKRSRDSILQMAAKAGLTYNLEDAKIANTLDAHRLFQFARAAGKGNVFFERLYAAVFTDGLNISDHATLLALAAETGLDADQAAQVLADSGQYIDEVQADINLAGKLGINVVPFFIINQKYAVSGAQPKEIFAQILEKLAGESA